MTESVKRFQIKVALAICLVILAFAASAIILSQQVSSSIVAVQLDQRTTVEGEILTLDSTTSAVSVREVMVAVREVRLFTNSWSSVGARMRTSLSQFAASQELVECKYFDASDDAQLANVSGISSFPTLLLIDADGVELARMEQLTWGDFEQHLGLLREVVNSQD